MTIKLLVICAFKYVWPLTPLGITLDHMRANSDPYCIPGNFRGKEILQILQIFGNREKIIHEF